MSKIKVACETYTWQMAGEMYKGKLDHIMKIANKAGFTGIEPETSFFGDLSDPVKMKEELDKHNLELAALCHAETWRNPKETNEERANSEKWVEFMTHFPDTMYLLVQVPGEDRSHLKERQQNLLSCVNVIAQRAHERGIKCSYHPNSPKGSVYRTEEDYKILLNNLNPECIGYTPDIGHMAAGGMNPLSVLKEYRDLVNMIHYKDMYANGEWAPTGEGIIDMKGITKYLIDTGFEGWIIMEDECDLAITEPDEVTLEDGAYIKSEILPLLK